MRSCPLTVLGPSLITLPTANLSILLVPAFRAAETKAANVVTGFLASP